MTAEQRPSPAAAQAFHTALIVDDHPLFCDALTMTLQAVAGIETVETAECLTTALARIEDGTYGACVRCGEPIAEARLDALPWTPLCRNCAP